MGSRLIIQTDHQPLRNLLSQTVHTPEQQCWIIKLIGFDFEVQYKSGRDNGPADALSRQDANMFMAIQDSTRPVLGILRELNQFYEKNSVAFQLIHDITSNPSEHPNYKANNGLILQNGRIYVPDDSCFHDRILHEFPDTATGGHNG